MSSTKINMFLSNGNPSTAQLRAHGIKKVAADEAPKPSSALGASMIKRIHTTKPGCGSCGRH